MNGMNLYPVEIDLIDRESKDILTVKIHVYDHPLASRWLAALDQVLSDNKHLEKNYCFLGFSDYERNGAYILDQVNHSIDAINHANLGYHIDDHFSMDDLFDDTPEPRRAKTFDGRTGRNLRQERFNHLHRYFEDLQGINGAMSPFYHRADPETKWHIRQLNLLCHEFECWALSYRKQMEAPEWQRPSQLMCWLNAPRFRLEDEDLQHFGVETINRDLGGVYLGVNKAIGKHHWEVFNDEGRDSRIDELTTTVMRGQTLAAADFDIEWGRNPAGFTWQQRNLQEFRDWLISNGFDPEDPNLTIGHPKIGQVDLIASFGTDDIGEIWNQLNRHLDVHAIHTNNQSRAYPYHWSDVDYKQQQVKELFK